jgi:phosphonate transport system ATP-binding protein
MNPHHQSVGNEAIALSVRGLSKCFRGSAKPVWSNVSFEIPRGQRVAIIGGNGTGKSTLLRCCMRLIEPDAGAIFFGHQQITGLQGRHLAASRSQVGFVFQKHNLVHRLSVLSNVIHGGMAHTRTPRLWFQSLAPQETREHAMHCLEQVNLADFCHRRTDQLSGGQSQRVAIARALMQKPNMIFADEPVASLDPQAGEDVMKVFSDLAQQQNLTLVFVTHHLEHALRYADRVLGLREGALTLDTATQDQSIQQLRGMYE